MKSSIYEARGLSHDASAVMRSAPLPPVSPPPPGTGTKMSSVTYHRFGERSGQGEEERHQPPAPVNGGVHQVPGVHGVGGDAVRGEPTVELVAEEDVAQFGPVVRQHGPVLLLGWRQQVQVHLPTCV